MPVPSVVGHRAVGGAVEALRVPPLLRLQETVAVIITNDENHSAYS